MKYTLSYEFPNPDLERICEEAKPGDEIIAPSFMAASVVRSFLSDNNKESTTKGKNGNVVVVK